MKGSPPDRCRAFQPSKTGPFAQVGYTSYIPTAFWTRDVPTTGAPPPSCGALCLHVRIFVLQRHPETVRFRLLLSVVSLR
jgi:hypothetical protein